MSSLSPEQKRRFRVPVVVSRIALVVICAVMAVGVMAAESARGQSDLSKVLIGKWEGDVQLPGRGDPKRTLVIDSVDASAKYSCS